MRDAGAGGGIRTPTGPILSRLPLPFGLHQHATRTRVAPSNAVDRTRGPSPLSSVPRAGVRLLVGPPRTVSANRSTSGSQRTAYRPEPIAPASCRVKSDTATRNGHGERIRTAE